MQQFEEDASSFKILKNKADKFDIKYKIIIIGDAGVGKSCICLRQTSNNFEENQESTLGLCNFYTDIKYKDITIKFEIWDTAGQEKYSSLISSLFNNCSFALLVYSIDE